MSLEEQIIDAIRSLHVGGWKSNMHNIWKQCTYDFNEVQTALQTMGDANILCRDDTGDYDIMENKDDKQS